MTIRVTTESAGHERLDAQAALKRAWVWYGVMLVIPMVLIVMHGFASVLEDRPLITDAQARMGFVATLLWIGFSGAIGFMGQEYYFRNYFKGQPVTPKAYLRGKLIAWTALISGAILATVLIWLSKQAFPHIFAAIISYVFMVTQYPAGSAMRNRNGDKDRAQLYEEPK